MLDGSSGRPSRKSIEWAPGQDATLQLRNFDKSSRAGEVRLTIVDDSSSGSGSSNSLKIALVDPDGGYEPDTKWMLPLRRVDSQGAVELVWVTFQSAVTIAAESCEEESYSSGSSGTTSSSEGSSE